MVVDAAIVQSMQGPQKLLPGTIQPYGGETEMNGTAGSAPHPQGDRS
jgi:hypothetical protein